MFGGPSAAGAGPRPPTAPPWVDSLGLDSALRLRPGLAALRRARRLAHVPLRRHGVGEPVADQLRVQPHRHLRDRRRGDGALVVPGRRAPRFPTLRFAFLEGGVAWAATSTPTSSAHWEKRNRDAVEHYDPARLDRELLDELFARIRLGAVRERLDRSTTAWASSAIPTRPDDARRVRPVRASTSADDVGDLRRAVLLRLRGRRPDERPRVRRRPQPARRAAAADLRLRHRPLGRARLPRCAGRGLGARRARPHHRGRLPRVHVHEPGVSVAARSERSSLASASARRPGNP